MNKPKPCCRGVAVGLLSCVILQWLFLNAALMKMLWVENSDIIGIMKNKIRQNVEKTTHLSIVLPYQSFNPAQIHEQLESWRLAGNPCKNSYEHRKASYKRRAELIIYVSACSPRNDDHTFSAVREMVAAHMKCFSNTRLICANLSSDENQYPAGPSIMFFKLFSDFNVRSEIEHATHIFWMEHDVTPLRPEWVEILFQEASRGGFWISGSVYKGRGLDEAAAAKSQANNDWLGHINGNALYDFQDDAFREFLALVQQYEPPKHIWKPFDVSIWKVLHAFPQTWPLHQKHRGKFKYSDFIDNWGFHISDSDRDYSRNRSSVYLLHGSNSSAGKLRPKIGRNVIWTDRVTKSLKLSVLIHSTAALSSFCYEAVMSTIRFVPDVLEIVLVVSKSDVSLFKRQFNKTSAKILRIATYDDDNLTKFPSLQLKASRLSAEKYCKGDLILFMSDEAVFNHELRTRDILWINKPVLKYQSYEKTVGISQALKEQKALSQALGFTVRHRFSHIPLQIYPRQVFPSARKYVEEQYNSSVTKFLQVLLDLHNGTVDVNEFDLLGALVLQQNAAAFALAPLDYEERSQMLLPPPLIQPPICMTAESAGSMPHRSRLKVLRNFKYTWKFKLACTRLPGLRAVISN